MVADLLLFEGTFNYASNGASFLVNCLIKQKRCVDHSNAHFSLCVFFSLTQERTRIIAKSHGIILDVLRLLPPQTAYSSVGVISGYA